MQPWSHTMSSTAKGRALPRGMRFHSVCSELRDFGDSSLLRDTPAFQQELLRKYLDNKGGREKKTNMFCSALNWGCYWLLKRLTIPSFAKERKSNSSLIKWNEQVTTMNLSQAWKQILPRIFLFLLSEWLKHQPKVISLWFTTSYASIFKRMA